MPTLSDEYQGIHSRLDQLRQRRAVLEAEEGKRRETREKLADELKAAGVDLGDLPGEKKRLEAEVESLQAEAVRLVDEFEQRLDAAEQGEPCESAADPADVTQEVGQSPAGEEVEID